MSDLKHFGILGMKWGRRKNTRSKNQHKDYSSDMIRSDKRSLGFFGPTLVNRYMNKGLDHQTSRKKAGRVIATTKLALAASVYTIGFLNSNPRVVEKGKRAAESFFMKFSSSNIVRDTGEVILNPNNYRVIRNLQLD